MARNPALERIAKEIDHIECRLRSGSPTTWTSPMEAVTSPQRWGYEIVDIFYGKVLPRKDQTVAMKGDCLRDPDGNLWEFERRIHNDLKLTPIVL